jgi:hypothetical protein
MIMNMIGGSTKKFTATIWVMLVVGLIIGAVAGVIIGLAINPEIRATLTLGNTSDTGLSSSESPDYSVSYKTVKLGDIVKYTVLQGEVTWDDRYFTLVTHGGGMSGEFWELKTTKGGGTYVVVRLYTHDENIVPSKIIYTITDN